MSLGTPQEVGAAPNSNAPGPSHRSGNPKISFPSHANSSKSQDMVPDHVNEAALAAAYQLEITSTPTLVPQRKETEQPGMESPAVEESAEAMLEGLGRQRPKVFDSAWAEIGFVFSISMSQVLSVGQSSNCY